MIDELWRVVEGQAQWSLQNQVQGNSDDIGLLEELVNETKPAADLAIYFSGLGYHALVYTQFRYPPPVPASHVARFRPAFFDKNVFYGSTDPETACYETAYYFMAERVHLKNPTSTAEVKTGFAVKFNEAGMIDITEHAEIDRIMNRNNTSFSHAYIQANPCDSLLYPSTRKADGLCVAVFEIKRLAKRPHERLSVAFTYIKEMKACRVDGEDGSWFIDWSEVA